MGEEAEGEADAVVAAPSPRSPPKYPDFCGRRRLQLEVQILNREIGFLEEELQSLEGLQPVSRCCKNVNDFVVAKSDPLILVNKRRGRSCCIWRWLRSTLRSNFAWICCFSECLIEFEKQSSSRQPDHSCLHCQCKCPSCRCIPVRSCKQSCCCSGDPCSTESCSCLRTPCERSCCSCSGVPCCRSCCSCLGVPCCRLDCSCPGVVCCRSCCSCLGKSCCNWFDTFRCKPHCKCLDGSCYIPVCCKWTSCFKPCCCGWKPSCSGPQCVFPKLSCDDKACSCALPSPSCPEFSCSSIWCCFRCTNVSPCFHRCTRLCCQC